jgi:membrane protease subunit HflK
MAGEPPEQIEPQPAPPLETGPAQRALSSAFKTVFTALRVLMIIVLVALVFSNTRFLQQNQRAVILRFGKAVGPGGGRAYGPGLVFAWPEPIDEIIVVDAERRQVLDVDDFMYREEWRERPSVKSDTPLDPARDGYTLTNDANIIHTAWRIEYQISDPVKYALSIEDPKALIRRALAAVVVRTSADFGVEEALWGAGLRMRSLVRQRLQDRLDQADSGIEIVAARTTVRREPPQTTQAFERLEKAGLEKDQMKQKASGYRQERLAAAAGDAGSELAKLLAALAEAEEEPQAQQDTANPEAEQDAAKIEQLRDQISVLLDRAAGQVASVLNDAKTYKTRVVEDAAGLHAVFEELDEKYRENPRVFVRQVYHNALAQIIQQAGSKFVVYPRDREWWILLEPRKPKPQPETPSGAGE